MPRNASRPPIQSEMPTRWKIIVSTATSWSSTAGRVSGECLRQQSDDRREHQHRGPARSHDDARQQRDQHRDRRADQVAPYVGETGECLRSRLGAGSAWLSDLPLRSAMVSGISASETAVQTHADSDAARIARYPPTSKIPDFCGGARHTAATSQPIVSAADRSKSGLHRGQQQLGQLGWYRRCPTTAYAGRQERRDRHRDAGADDDRRATAMAVTRHRLPGAVRDPVPGSAESVMISLGASGIRTSPASGDVASGTLSRVPSRAVLGGPRLVSCTRPVPAGRTPPTR